MTATGDQLAGDGKRIGLLGGSFNPAHAGHRHISICALDLLKLDEVWWLVSPQNPLKPANDMAPLADRVAGARKIAEGQPIRVSDIERELGSHYTADTLTALQARFPQTRFVWLMGADNLLEIDRWSRWQQIFDTVPMAVFARPSYSAAAENAKASRHFARFRLDSTKAEELADHRPPAWVFLKTPEMDISATTLRARTKSSGAVN